jgi:phosphomannomutase
MRKEDALFAGEMSGHFYFRDYFYADNGIIPFLILLEVLSTTGKKVSELFAPYFERYFISGELNYHLPAGVEVARVLATIEAKHPDAEIDRLDGVSIAYADWRANVRGSNTEPLVRLNVEAKNEALMRQKTKELEGWIASVKAN